MAWASRKAGTSFGGALGKAPEDRSSEEANWELKKQVKYLRQKREGLETQVGILTKKVIDGLEKLYKWVDMNTKQKKRILSLEVERLQLSIPTWDADPRTVGLKERNMELNDGATDWGREAAGLETQIRTLKAENKE